MALEQTLKETCIPALKKLDPEEIKLLYNEQKQKCSFGYCSDDCLESILKIIEQTIENSKIKEPEEVERE